MPIVAVVPILVTLSCAALGEPSAFSAADLQSMLTSALVRDDVEPPPPASSNDRLRSWELPAVTVEGEAQSPLYEEQLVGSYHQPRWTASRRFPSTRVYVIPDGKVEVELWARGTFDRDGTVEWRTLQEVEIGLPYRFQIDVYFRQDFGTDSGDALVGAQFEVRWALADWGELWGNPTLYFEYIVLDDRPSKIEPKLLLGGEIDEGWHWGVNLVGEFEMGGEREYEYEITSAISYSIIDSYLSLGIEDILKFANVEDDRGDFETTLVIGPSLQWKPLPAMTLNIAPLLGVTGNSPALQLYLNLGWEF